MFAALIISGSMLVADAVTKHLDMRYENRCHSALDVRDFAGATVYCHSAAEEMGDLAAEYAKGSQEFDYASQRGNHCVVRSDRPRLASFTT
jgi:hypothetical protein